MLWQAVRRCSCKLLLLSHSGYFSYWRWYWRDVRSSANTTPSLWAAGCSNELPWVVSRLTEMACPLIGGSRKRDFRITGDNALVKREKKNLFPPHLNASLFIPIIISSTGLRITSANMSLSPRRRTCVKWEVSGVLFGRCLLVFQLILIILLALNIRVLFIRLSLKGPEDWNNVALYWSDIITARKKTKKQTTREESSHLMTLFCIFVYTLLQEYTRLKN